MNEIVRIARATICGFTGLLLGGPGIAVVAVALLPALLVACRVLMAR